MEDNPGNAEAMDIDLPPSHAPTQQYEEKEFIKIIAKYEYFKRNLFLQKHNNWIQMMVSRKTQNAIDDLRKIGLDFLKVISSPQSSRPPPFKKRRMNKSSSSDDRRSLDAEPKNDKSPSSPTLQDSDNSGISWPEDIPSNCKCLVEPCIETYGRDLATQEMSKLNENAEHILEVSLNRKIQAETYSEKFPIQDFYVTIGYRKITFCIALTVTIPYADKWFQLIYMSNSDGCIFWYEDTVRVLKGIKYQSLAARHFISLIKHQWGRIKNNLVFSVEVLEPEDPLILPFTSFYAKINNYLEALEYEIKTKKLITTFLKLDGKTRSIFPKFIKQDSLKIITIQAWTQRDLGEEWKIDRPDLEELINIQFPELQSLYSYDQNIVHKISQLHFKHFQQIRFIGEYDYDALRESVKKNHGDILTALPERIGEVPGFIKEGYVEMTYHLKSNNTQIRLRKFDINVRTNEVILNTKPCYPKDQLETFVKYEYFKRNHHSHAFNNIMEIINSKHIKSIMALNHFESYRTSCSRREFTESRLSSADTDSDVSGISIPEENHPKLKTYACDNLKVEVRKLYEKFGSEEIEKTQELFKLWPFMKPRKKPDGHKEVRIPSYNVHFVVTIGYRKITIRRTIFKPSIKRIEIRVYMSNSKGCIWINLFRVRFVEGVKYQSLAAKHFFCLIRQHVNINQIVVEVEELRPRDPSILPFCSFYQKVNKYLKEYNQTIDCRFYRANLFQKNRQYHAISLNHFNEEYLKSIAIERWDKQGLCQQNDQRTDVNLLESVDLATLWNKISDMDVRFYANAIGRVDLSTFHHSHKIRMQIETRDDFEALLRAFCELPKYTNIAYKARIFLVEPFDYEGAVDTALATGYFIIWQIGNLNDKTINRAQIERNGIWMELVKKRVPNAKPKHRIKFTIERRLE